MRRLFILRKDLALSPGKACAMVGHCAESYWTNWFRQHTDLNGFVEGWIDEDMFNQYINASFVKTICEARNLNHLMKAEKIAEEIGLIKDSDYFIISDNCMTELTPEYYDENGQGRVVVGIAFKPLADDVAHKISKKFQLYK